jgi:hypothetical protein
VGWRPSELPSMYNALWSSTMKSRRRPAKVSARSISWAISRVMFVALGGVMKRAAVRGFDFLIHGVITLFVPFQLLSSAKYEGMRGRGRNDRARRAMEGVGWCRTAAPLKESVSISTGRSPPSAWTAPTSSMPCTRR